VLDIMYPYTVIQRAMHIHHSVGVYSDYDALGEVRNLDDLSLEPAFCVG
jgi:hypothetical protein